MIIDLTQSKIERDFNLAYVQWQLSQVVNDPNLTIVTGCPFPYVELTTEEKTWLLKNGPNLRHLSR